MRKTIGYIIRLLPVLLMLPMLGSCNDEDDVAEIFVGKTWKVSRIVPEGSTQQFPEGLWSSEAEKNNIMTAFNNTANYTLKFTNGTGTETGGEFEARGVKATIKGTWNADGETNALTLNVKSTGATESDALAELFVNGVKKTEKYKGDANNLTLYFKEGQNTMIIGLTPQR